MGDRSEPVRKYDVQRWNSTWDRIRAKQAEERAAAAAAELQEGGETPPTDEEG
jgi:hypothetical protein